MNENEELICNEDLKGSKLADMALDYMELSTMIYEYAVNRKWTIGDLLDGMTCCLLDICKSQSLNEDQFKMVLDRALRCFNLIEDSDTDTND